MITIPALFELMVSTKSNWLLIKLIKLLTELCRAEERLLPKLQAKYIEMMSIPKAKSVQFELIKSVFTTRLGEDSALLQLARDMLLNQFLKANDPNLAYLGLDAFQMLLTNLRERQYS